METHFEKQPVHLGELWDAVYNLEVLLDKRKVRGKPEWASYKRPSAPEQKPVGSFGPDDRIRGKSYYEWE